MIKGGAVRSDPLQRRELPATPRVSAGWSAEYSVADLAPDTSARSAPSHTQHSGAATGLLRTLQPIASDSETSAGQVTPCTGTTLLNAAYLVASFIAGLDTTGSTPTQGMALLKNRPQ